MVGCVGQSCCICSNRKTKNDEKWNIHLTHTHTLRVKEAVTEKTADYTLLNLLFPVCLRGWLQTICAPAGLDWPHDTQRTWRHEKFAARNRCSLLSGPQEWTGRCSHRGLNCLLNPTKNNAEDIFSFSLIYGEVLLTNAKQNTATRWKSDSLIPCRKECVSLKWIP